jgi:hypothetical protein
VKSSLLWLFPMRLASREGGLVIAFARIYVVVQLFLS